MTGDSFRMVITVGGTYEGGFTLTDEAGDPLTSAWTGRLEVRDGYGGALVTAFAASGADGTLTIDDDGHCLLLLPSAITENLTPTVDSEGRINAAHVADIEVWLTATPAARYKPETPIRVFIRPEVTTA